MTAALCVVISPLLIAGVSRVARRKGLYRGKAESEVGWGGVPREVADDVPRASGGATRPVSFGGDVGINAITEVRFGDVYKGLLLAS